MVRVYISYDVLYKDNPSAEIVKSNDLYFLQEEDGKTGFDDTDFRLMKEIDNISFIDGIESTNTAMSKFGMINMFELSTGCKTAINLHHAIRDKKNVVVDITECGKHAVELCFDLADNTGVPVVLQHVFLIGGEDRHEFIVNGSNIVKTNLELAEYIARG